MHYGLDIGGTKIAPAVFDASLGCIEQWQTATPVNDYEAFLAIVCEQVARADMLAAKCPGNDDDGVKGNTMLCLGSVGIALPGVIQADGRVLSSNVPCLNGRFVADDLARRLGRPVAIGNDCRCFTLSEAMLGAGRGHQRILGVILGTGLGGGICIDGKLILGAQCLAGEFGHLGLAASVVMRHQLPLFDCGCGLKGCAETYVSGTGLGRLYRHFGGAADTYQWLDAYRLGQMPAVQAFDAYVDALGSVLAGQILSMDPDCIVFGGGLSEVREIMAAIPDATARHLFNGVSLPEFKVAEFGAVSGVRGAALLGRELMFGRELKMGQDLSAYSPELIANSPEPIANSPEPGVNSPEPEANCAQPTLLRGKAS